MKERNQTLDLLRILGIALVIMNHCAFSDTVNEIIAFDVVLLMFVMGMSFALSSFELSKDSYLKYAYKRFHRLILPCWVFLIILYEIFDAVFKEGFGFNVLVHSFLLLPSGIMFIWIYRVLFTSSLLIPFFKKPIEKHSPWVLLILFTIVYIASDILHRMVFVNLSGIGKILEYVLTYTIGYLYIALVGMLNTRWNNKERYGLVVVFAILAFIGRYLTNFVPIWEIKHPPLFTYSAFGLACSLFLYNVFQHIHLPESWNKYVVWLSNQARPIYLWHAFWFYILQHYKITLPPIVLFIVLLGLSIIGAYGEEYALKNWRNRPRNV